MAVTLGWILISNWEVLYLALGIGLWVESYRKFINMPCSLSKFQFNENVYGSETILNTLNSIIKKFHSTPTN
jgi:hypothetical protein